MGVFGNASQGRSFEQTIRATAERAISILGRKFTSARTNWTTYEKEAYATVQSFNRLDYLLCGARQTHEFTDLKNVLYVFAP